jgi:hypothetical protein
LHARERERERERERGGGEAVTSKPWDRTPASMSMGGDISVELLIFFRRPKPSFNLLFAAATMAAHLSV